MAETRGQAVFLKGNLSEGWIAYGPYQDIHQALDAHMDEEGWALTMQPAKKEED